MASALKKIFSGRPTFHNPILGESLYELCRKATTRQIEHPDEILNQQIVHLINEERATPMAAADSVACLKKRLNMEHPQKQFLAVVLTAKVLREANAAVGMYTEELLQEVARVAARPSYNSPQASRAKQAAMDMLRDYGRLGGDAFRHVASTPYTRPMYPGPPGPPGPPGAQVQQQQQRDPAALAAERESLLDEIVRMVHQAHGSCEILNELLQAEAKGDAIAKVDTTGGAAGGQEAKAEFERDMVEQLFADLTALRDSFNVYLEQLGGLQGTDAEEVMAKALDAVDMLDRTLAKASAQQETRLMSQPTSPLAPADGTTAAAPEPKAEAEAAPAAAAAAAVPAAAAAAAVADRMKSINLIDFDDEPTPTPAAAAPAAAPGVVDPFEIKSPAAPAAVAAPAAAAAAFDESDPFALLAATSSGGAPPPAAPAAPAPAVAAVPAAAAAPHDPFADAAPAWGGAAAPAAAAAPSEAPAIDAPKPAPVAIPAAAPELGSVSAAVSPPAAAAASFPPASAAAAGPTGVGGLQQQQMGYPSQQTWGGAGYMGQQPQGYGYGGVPNPYAMPQGGYMQQYTGAYMQQYTGGYMPPQAGGYMGQPTGGYMPPQQQLGGGMYPQQYGGGVYSPQQQQQQPATAAVGAPSPSVQQPANPFGGPAAGFGGSNPFAAPTAAPAAAAPGAQPVAGGAAGGAAGSNPFQQQVDADWDRLFAKQ